MSTAEYEQYSGGGEDTENRDWSSYGYSFPSLDQTLQYFNVIFNILINTALIKGVIYL